MLPGQISSINFMIDRQAHTYRSDMHSWAMRVQNTRNFMEALRLAQHPPMPGQMVRGLPYATNSTKTRARQDVEQSLILKLNKIDPDTVRFPDLLRMAQGHWPRLWGEIDRLRQMQASSKSAPKN